MYCIGSFIEKNSSSHKLARRFRAHNLVHSRPSYVQDLTLYQSQRTCTRSYSRNSNRLCSELSLRHGFHNVIIAAEWLSLMLVRHDSFVCNEELDFTHSLPFFLHSFFTRCKATYVHYSLGGNPKIDVWLIWWVLGDAGKLQHDESNNGVACSWWRNPFLGCKGWIRPSCSPQNLSQVENFP